MHIAVEGKIVCCGDGKASVGERIVAFPINYGPIEGEGFRIEIFEEGAPEGGVVILGSAEIDGGVG